MYADSKSTLPASTDELITRIIGCALTVHRELGPGFLESIYATALQIELTAAHIPFDSERSLTVNYRGTAIPGQRVDLIVGNEVIVEIKAVSRIDPIFEAKTLSYMRTARVRAGLLMNFNELLLKNGIKRFVL